MIRIAAKEQNRKIKTKIKQKHSQYEKISEQNPETDKTIDTQQPKFPCEMRINRQKPKKKN